MKLKIPFKNEVISVLYDKNDEDIIKRHTWYINKHKNRNTSYVVCGKCKQYIHRLIMKPNKNMTVDHINGNGFDNRRKNMRVCTISQNLSNTPMYSNNTTGYKGVYLEKRGKGKNRLVVQLYANKKRYRRFGFRIPFEAAIEADKLMTEIHGKFAKLNFK